MTRNTTRKNAEVLLHKAKLFSKNQKPFRKCGAVFDLTGFLGGDKIEIAGKGLYP